MEPAVDIRPGKDATYDGLYSKGIRGLKLSSDRNVCDGMVLSASMHSEIVQKPCSTSAVVDYTDPLSIQNLLEGLDDSDEEQNEDQRPSYSFQEVFMTQPSYSFKDVILPQPSQQVFRKHFGVRDRVEEASLSAGTETNKDPGVYVGVEDEESSGDVEYWSKGVQERTCLILVNGKDRDSTETGGVKLSEDGSIQHSESGSSLSFKIRNFPTHHQARIMSRVDIKGARKQFKAGADNVFYELVEDTLQRDTDFRRKVTVIHDLREMTSKVLHYYKGDSLDELPGLVDFTVVLNLSAWQKQKFQKEFKKFARKFKQSSVGSAVYLHPKLYSVSKDWKSSDSNEKMDELIESDRLE
ncbi:hypothetical protein J5N97_000402 [Dioscorea zingiberensis]|uniref:Uncharacterized protein n=1 Tax=Dioscorea zingiberensis TaxID=325984 RepID=A0A9D5BS96_9LILI|nr:hypothetical protein J5N97_000402 [Dioscorea zingiberensis]